MKLWDPCCWDPKIKQMRRTLIHILRILVKGNGRAHTQRIPHTTMYCDRLLLVPPPSTITISNHASHAAMALLIKNARAACINRSCHHASCIMVLVVK